MKKFLTSLCIVILLVGCGGDKINGRDYPSYGIFNHDSNSSPMVCYRPSVTSVIIALVFLPLVIISGYVILLDIMEPVRMKTSKEDQCRLD